VPRACAANGNIAHDLAAKPPFAPRRNMIPATTLPDRDSVLAKKTASAPPPLCRTSAPKTTERACGGTTSWIMRGERPRRAENESRCASKLKTGDLDAVPPTARGECEIPRKSRPAMRPPGADSNNW